MTNNKGEYKYIFPQPQAERNVYACRSDSGPYFAN
jgi:hypothetical protein